MEKIGGSQEEDLAVWEGDVCYSVRARALFKSRIYVITQAPERRLLGCLAVPRWSNVPTEKDLRFFNRKRVAKVLRYIVFADLYFLNRALKHGDSFYLQEESGEIPRLNQVLEVCHRLNGVLLGLRKGNVDELIVIIVGMVEKAILDVNPNATNSLKKEILNQFTAIGNIEDSLGRVNNGALLARLVAIRERTMRREADAVDINAVWALRRRVVSMCLEILEFQVKAAADYLKQVLDNWHEVSILRRIRVAEQLEIYARVFEGIDIQPFRPTFLYSTDEFKHAAEFLKTNKVAEAHALLKTTYAGFQLRDLRIELEKLMFAVSRKRRFPKTDFDFSETISRLEINIAILNSWDTSQMRDFDKIVITAGLRQVIICLEIFDIQKAHGTFSNTIKLI
ncbi:hypothetical protein C4546_04225 [Candidatus Parcubacteria bacterium]|nr:MAG: hypothetical protein C4546_04225 [Candidatus Parcubacteria bacterium]